MAKKINSVIVDDLFHCAECGRTGIAVHHIFFGPAKRRFAQEDGYIIGLCPRHHTGDEGIHFDRQMDLRWKRIAQSHYERTHSREEFINRYGKSYL